MKKLLTLFALIVTLMGAMAQTQNKIPMEYKALEAFNLGNYDAARKAYLLIYIDYDIEDALKQVAICDSCIKYRLSGLELLALDSLTQARSAFQRVLSLNPLDKKSVAMMERIDYKLSNQKPAPLNTRKVTATCEATLEVRTIVTRNSYCK